VRSTCSTAPLRPLNSLGDNYQISTWRGAVRFGVPFSELDTVFFGLGYERTDIADDAFLPNSYFLYRQEFGPTSYALPLTIGWSRDGRDSAINPTEGRYQRVNGEWSCARRLALRCARTCSTSST
jgi:outer membrane protein insertion porin family